jgi:hypothetical protein
MLEKFKVLQCLTLILLTWRIWWAPNNASKWQIGFNSAFKGLMTIKIYFLNLHLDFFSRKSWCSERGAWRTFPHRR